MASSTQKFTAKKIIYVLQKEYRRKLGLREFYKCAKLQIERPQQIDILTVLDPKAANISLDELMKRHSIQETDLSLAHVAEKLGRAAEYTEFLLDMETSRSSYEREISEDPLKMQSRLVNILGKHAQYDPKDALSKFAKLLDKDYQLTADAMKETMLPNSESAEACMLLLKQLSKETQSEILKYSLLYACTPENCLYFGSPDLLQMDATEDLDDRLVERTKGYLAPHFRKAQKRITQLLASAGEPIEQYLKEALNNPDEGIRKRAAAAIGPAAKHIRSGTFINAWKNPVLKDIVESSLDLFTEAHHNTAIEIFKTKFESDHSVFSMIRPIAEHSAETAARLLQQAYESKNPDTRRQAVKHTKYLYGETSYEILRAAFSDTEEVILEAIATTSAIFKNRLPHRELEAAQRAQLLFNTADGEVAFFPDSHTINELMNHKSDTVRKEAVTLLGLHPAKLINPNTIQKRAELGIEIPADNSSLLWIKEAFDGDARKNAVKIMPRLHEINPNLYFSMLQEALDDEDYEISVLAYSHLVQLVETEAQTAADLAINYLEKKNLLRTDGYLEEKIRDKIADHTTRILEKLAEADPDAHIWMHNKIPIRTYLYGLYRPSAAEQIARFVDSDTQIQNLEFSIYYRIIKSKYGEKLSEAELTRKLTEWLYEGVVEGRYARAKVCLDWGIARDIDDLRECIEMQVEGFDVLGKIKSAGLSDVYLALKEGKDRKEFLRIIKIPKINAENITIRELKKKYGGAEGFLQKLIRDEDYINELLINTSEDEFPSPLPKYQGYVKVSRDNVGLVYEFVNGHTLAEWMDGRTIEEKISKLALASNAIHYLHSRGIIHNDIKGNNMMVAKNGKIYVLDLGVSRMDTAVTSARGKPEYVAPERFRGYRPDELSDQYSFGIMMYTLLTGNAPLNAGNTEDEQAQFIEDLIEGKIEIYWGPIETISPELKTIVQRCTLGKPRKRYASMKDVAEALLAL